MSEQVVALSWATPAVSTNSSGIGNDPVLPKKENWTVSMAPSKPPIVGKVAVPVMSVVELAITTPALTTLTTTPDGTGPPKVNPVPNLRNTATVGVSWQRSGGKSGVGGHTNPGCARKVQAGTSQKP